MPYAIKKTGSAYSVINTQTNKFHSFHTTLKKAQAQVRLLDQIYLGPHFLNSY